MAFWVMGGLVALAVVLLLAVAGRVLYRADRLRRGLDRVARIVEEQRRQLALDEVQARVTAVTHRLERLGSRDGGHGRTTRTG
jgi:hypothetical protein